MSSHTMPFAAGSKNNGLHKAFPTGGRFGGESVADKIAARQRAEKERQMAQAGDAIPLADTSSDREPHI